MTIPSSLENASPEVLDRFTTILKVPVTFDSPKEEGACNTMVDGLTEEELECVANISYAYWAMKTLEKTDIATPEVARKVATKVARWHLKYVGHNDAKSALKRLKEAVQIRKDRNLELLRTCFDKDFIAAMEEGDPSKITSQKFQNHIESDTKKQLQFFRGQDVEGRAVLIKLPRMVGETTEDAYLDQQLFVAEKAAAVTEYLSAGQQETICAIFSTKNQKSSVTPALKWQLSLIKLLQQLFPGRMGRVIVLDAPFMIRGIFNSIKPFLSASLRESTFLLAGSSAVDKLKETLGEDKYQILDDDTGELIEPVDVDKYLYETPFYLPYGHNM